MNEVKKEMKRIEQQQAVQAQLGELTSTIKQIDKVIDEFNAEARQCILDNDESGFETIAGSIFYFSEIKKVIQTVRVNYLTFTKTAQFMGTIESLRPVLKQTAQMMDNMPSLSKNNKDLMKFKKALLKGQLNTKAMTGMLSNLNPASVTSHSKEEYAELRASLLAGNKGMASNIQANTNTASSTQSNLDFFDEMNK